MKKNSLRLFMLTSLLFLLSLCFYSCGECEHEFGEWAITDIPTCENDGKREKACKNCQEKVSEAIEKLGHDYEPGEFVLMPTCEASGLQEFICKRVSTHKETRTIPPLGHNYSEPQCIKAPSCTENGLTVAICQNDSSHVIEETVQCLGHAFGEYETLSEATCESDATLIAACNNESCSETDIITVEGSALGHSYKNKICSVCETVMPSIKSWDIAKNTSSELEAHLYPSSDSKYELVIIGKGEMADFSSNNAPWSEYGDSISSLSISADTTYIGSYAFQGLIGLKEIRIDVNVIDIGGFAFSGCTGIEKIFYNANVSSQQNNSIFAEVGTETNGATLYIGKNVEKIPNSMFFSPVAAPHNIKRVEFEDGSVCQSIGAHAFKASSALTDIVLPNSIKEIGDFAFFECGNLTNVVLPVSLTYLGEYSFSGCSSLIEVIIPDSITEIHTGAFSDCGALKSVVIGKGVKTVGAEAFSNCSALTDITFGNSLELIAEKSFFECISLSKITLPDSLKHFDPTAFSETNVREKDNGITYIDRWVVECDKFAVRVLALKPDTVGFAEGAFAECERIETLLIPSTVKHIKDAAFYDCSKLKEVFYHGEKADFKLLSIGEGNDNLTAATIYYYTDICPVNALPRWHYVDGEITVWSGWSRFESPIILISETNESIFSKFDLL